MITREASKLSSNNATPLLSRAMNILERDTRALAHSVEDAARVEQVPGRVKLSDLTELQYAYPVVRDDGAQAVCMQVLGPYAKETR